MYKRQRFVAFFRYSLVERFRMQFISIARYVRFSPYKLRPIADVVRGKNVAYALNWLSTLKLQRTTPVKKVIESAAANAKNLRGIEAIELRIQEIRVDEGPSQKYFKPGAMGRTCVFKRRSCHMSVALELIERKEV